MGRIVGEHLEYYEDGSQMWRYPTSDGYYNGVAEEFYEDGGIKTRILFVNGFAEDVTTHCDEDGQVISRIPYKHGEPNGIATYYDDGDRISMTLPYENGKRQGFSMYYDDDGDVFRTSIFIDNEYIGSRQTDYYEKGVKSCECDIEGYLPDGGTEAFYMCEGSECDGHNEFLEENFEIVADRCRERFGKKRPDLDEALYVQFFGEQYHTIAESPLAQKEFCNYEELDVCDIMAIDDDTFFRYMARDLLLRLRLPNDGETEKKTHLQPQGIRRGAR